MYDREAVAAARTIVHDILTRFSYLQELDRALEGVAQLEGAVSTLQARKAELEAEISTLEDHKKSIHEELDLMEEQLDALHQAFDQKRRQMEDEVHAKAEAAEKDFQEKLEAYNLRLAAVSEQINLEQNRLEELRAKVAQEEERLEAAKAAYKAFLQTVGV